jgi:hypothetical protein
VAAGRATLVELGLGTSAIATGLSAIGYQAQGEEAGVRERRPLDIRSYHDAEAFAVFHPLARAISARTYQERLLGSGFLPEDMESVRRIGSLATQDRLRAWLLFLDGTPIAYLCCTAEGGSILYSHVGHDPAHNDLSPGAVLQVEAMRELFDERDFARFDFTEGEGQHKRQFSTDGTACVDVLLLRTTLANRAAVATLRIFDSAMAAAKCAATHPTLKGVADKIRR